MSGTFAGGRLHIGTTAAINFTTDQTAQAAFEADTYAEIKEISNVGEIGASANVVQFPVVSDEFVKKSKGTRNAGDPVVVVGYVADDAGQVAMRAAEKTKFYYNFKLVLADAIDENHTDTTIYFRALVAGTPKQFGGVEDFVTESYTLGIYPRPLEIPSESFSPTSP